MTRKGDKVYLHIFAWPDDGHLTIEDFSYTAKHITQFTGESLPFHQSARCLEITLPQQAPEPDVSVLMVEVNATDRR